MQVKINTFFQFCRKFIVGEDWAATAITIWSIVLVYSFAKFYHVNIWYIFPLLVLLALLVSLFRGEEQYLKLKKTSKKSLSAFWQLLIPLLIVVIFPPSFLILLNVNIGANGLVPELLLFNLVFATTVALILYRLFPKQPLTTSLLGAIASILIIVKVQDYILTAYFNASNFSHTTYLLCSATILVVEAFIILEMNKKSD
jgi:hypothetical protein